MTTLSKLIRLREAGLMPSAGLIWLGVGFRPPKRNAIAIDPARLPAEEEWKAFAGLDVVLIATGFTKYGVLRSLCGSLLAARPRRLQVVDLDYKRVAYLKLGGF